MKIKKFLICSMVFLLSLTGIASATEVANINVTQTINNEYKILINNLALETNYKPYKSDSTIMVPLKDIAVKFNYQVNWNKFAKRIEMINGKYTTSVKSGVNSYYFNQISPRPLSKAPEIKNGTTYVPVEFFKDILGYSYSVDANNNINIYIAPFNKTDIGTAIKFDGEITNIEKSRNGYYMVLVGSRFNGTVLMVGGHTTISDVNGNIIDASKLKAGDKITGEHSRIMTMSIPPQSSAFKISLSN